MRYYRNSDWLDSHMLESHMCAETEMDAASVVSYSDIVYQHSTVQRLMASDAEVALVVDRDWHKRYAGRSHKAETQAEKVVVCLCSVLQSSIAALLMHAPSFHGGERSCRQSCSPPE